MSAERHLGSSASLHAADTAYAGTTWTTVLGTRLWETLSATPLLESPDCFKIGFNEREVPASSSLRHLLYPLCSQSEHLRECAMGGKRVTWAGASPEHLFRPERRSVMTERGPALTPRASL